MFIVLPSFWSHFIQIFYLVVALTPVTAFCTPDYGCPFTSLIPALNCHIPQTHVHFLVTVVSSAFHNYGLTNEECGQLVPTFCDESN